MSKFISGVLNRYMKPRVRASNCLLHRFARSHGGATAVEFALVSAPFFGLLAIILQTSLMFWAARNLDDALQRAGRTIYTGQFQKANPGLADTQSLLAKMKSAMCGPNVSAIFDCSTLKLDIALSTSFANGSTPTALDPNTKDWSAGFGSNYSCAKPGTIVVFTAAVKYRVAFSFMYVGSPGFGDGSRLIQSTAVFRTEPYDTSSSQGC